VVVGEADGEGEAGAEGLEEATATGDLPVQAATTAVAARPRAERSAWRRLITDRLKPGYLGAG